MIGKFDKTPTRFFVFLKIGFDMSHSGDAL